jgi:hypothetical protein
MKRMQVKIAPEKKWGDYTGRYENKNFSPCIQSCGNDISRNCEHALECDFWREYAFKRRMARKKLEEKISKRGL